ncbi:MAG: putative LPS assembly protein LptD, partial [Longimicrobiales bacterium]
MIWPSLRAVVVSISLGTLVSLLPAAGLAQEPPPTVQVDSTRLRIFEQLKGLAKPPGFDSTWLIPDSLLSDSALAEREARLTGRRPTPGSRGRAPGAGLGGADSLMTALLDLEDYAVTEYASAGADFGAQDKQLVLLGTAENRARLIREGEELTADTLIYSDEGGKVYSVGSAAIYQPADGDPVNSARIVFDLNQGIGTATDASTRYTAGADWILRGDQLLVREGAVYGHSTLFTSCEEEVPHYHFASQNIKILSENNILVARPVKLYFADVPVMWLPFIATSTKTGRASGILTPTFSVNDIVRTSSSYSRRISNIGFYWAASEYWDAVVAMDWWSGEHVSLTGGIQYEWARQFLSGNLNFRRFWGQDGAKNYAYDASSAWQASERTSLRFRARYTSSTDLVRRTSFDPREVVQSIDSEGGLSHRFGFGNLSLSGNRREYLSDDRVEMTAPIVSFSLTPKTFFQASPVQARFYNNLTWSGSANYRRSSTDRQPQADSAFTESAADAIKTSGGLSTSFTLGN